MCRSTPVYSWSDVPVIMDIVFAARLTGKTPDHLQKMAQRGQFPAYKVGREWRIDKEDLQKWIAEQKRKNPYFSAAVL